MENNFKHIVLDNGLNIFLYNDNTKHSTYVNLSVKYGAIHSDFISNGKKHHIEDGMAHFLEHYLLEKSKYGDICNLLSDKLISSNGTTSPLKTCYYFNAVTDVDYAVEILIKGIHSTTLEEKYFEETKKPIYAEAKMELDKKGYVMRKTIRKNMFKKISFQTVLGSLKDIENITLEKAQLCYDTFYQPKNECIFITGRFDEKHIVNLIKKIYKDVERKYPTFEIIKFKEPRQIKKPFEICHMPTANPYVGISYKIDIKNYQGFKRMKLEDYFYDFSLINFSEISSLHKKLIKDKIITDAIGTGTYIIYDTLVFTISAFTDKKEEFIEAVKKMINTKDFKDDPKTLDASKKRYKLDIIERPDYICGVIGPLMNNVIDYDYLKIDTIEDADTYSFNEYKETLYNLDFENYTVVVVEEKKS